MTAFLKDNLKFIVFLLIFGLVGGYFTVLYSMEGLDDSLIEEAVSQVGSIDVVILISTVQSALYSLVLGLFGKFLSEKIGLWRKIGFERKPLITVGIVSLVGGILFIIPDYFIFGSFSQVIKDSYAVKPTVNYIISCLTYAPVVEEVMLRLFFMSLISFALWKLSRKENVTEKHIIIANVASALLFAAGHLPSTAIMLGLTPIIIIRCFLMNGAFGLAFGYLYRKHGIQYAMLAHAGVHIVSKLIWILFI